MTIEITSRTENGYTVYNFEADNTAYELITRDGVQFDVWSKRNKCGFGAPLSCYNSLADLAARSKALANLVKLIGE